MFENIVKNEKNKAYFQQVIQKKQLSHTYLFEGQKGLGKKTFAYELAKYILCENPENHQPCGKCKSCTLVKHHSHPDLIYIEKKDKAIKIDEIREKLVQPMYIKPMHSDHKVFILNDVETLDLNSQNTLLKTIEEPQSYAKIILLTTDPNRLLPTVLSRCLTIHFLPLDKEDVYQYLVENFNEIHQDNENEETDVEKVEEISFFDLQEVENPVIVPTEDELKLLRICSDFSQGSIGYALEIFKNQESFFEILEASIEQLIALIKGDRMNVFVVAEFIEKNMKENLEQFFMFWKVWFSNAIYLKTHQSLDRAYEKYADVLQEQSELLSFQVIQKIISLIDETYFKYHKRNISLKMLLDQLCSEIYLNNSHE